MGQCSILYVNELCSIIIYSLLDLSWQNYAFSRTKLSAVLFRLKYIYIYVLYKNKNNFPNGQESSKKNKDRREGKGSRCCLGDRIDSIPCYAS